MLRRAIPVAGLWPFVRALVGGRDRHTSLTLDANLLAVRVAQLNSADETDAERWTRERIELLQSR